MALSNLFRINFPYGIQYDTKTKNSCFINREYLQLGIGKNDLENFNHNLVNEIGVKYKSLTISKIDKIVSENSNQKAKLMSQQGDVITYFFYDHATNPSNKGNEKYFDKYFNILKELSKFIK